MCEEVVGLKHSLSSLTLLMSTPSSSFFTSQATRMERYGGNLSKLVAGRLQANVQQYRESPELSMSLETSASYRPAAAHPEMIIQRPVPAVHPNSNGSSVSENSNGALSKSSKDLLFGNQSMFALATTPSAPKEKAKPAAKKPKKVVEEEEEEDDDEVEEEEEEEEEEKIEDDLNDSQEYAPSDSGLEDEIMADLSNGSMSEHEQEKALTKADLAACTEMIVANGLPDNGTNSFVPIDTTAPPRPTPKKRKQSPPVVEEEQSQPKAKKAKTKNSPVGDDDGPETINTLWRRLLNIDFTDDEGKDNTRRLTAFIDLASESCRCDGTPTSYEESILTHARTHKALNDAFGTLETIDDSAIDLIVWTFVPLWEPILTSN